MSKIKIMEENPKSGCAPAKINLNPQLAPPLKIGHICLMGKVIIKIKLTNLSDLVVQHRKLSSAKPREVEVEALVDTGATRLYLKPGVIRALGLEKVDTMISQTGNGPAKRWVYDPVRLECQGRHGNFDVVGVGENVPNLVGQISSGISRFRGGLQEPQAHPQPRARRHPDERGVLNLPFTADSFPLYA